MDCRGTRRTGRILIRPADSRDRDAIWAIIGPVIREGETYALDRDLSAPDALDYWMGPDHACFVFEDETGVLGTYYLKANQSGGGSHVANCGYMVGQVARGKGVARAMCAHSLDEAARRGFRAMQFNFVIASNRGAIGLWESMGFSIVGRLPEAFDHPQTGPTDALVMYRKL